MTAFCRIDEQPIRRREPIAEPDALIVQDPTLLHQVDLFAGLRPGGVVLLNSSRSSTELGLAELSSRERPPLLLTVPATEIARAASRPSAARRGAARGLRGDSTGSITLEGVELAMRERFAGEVGEGNVAAAR